MNIHLNDIYIYILKVLNIILINSAHGYNLNLTDIDIGCGYKINEMTTKL